MAIYFYASLAEAHTFVNEWFIRDDAFYYFKVAQNITEGRGSTLDGVNPTNGYHPLWMLVCIPIFALARFDLILPLRVLVVVSGGISAATGVLLFRLVKRTLSAPAAVLAAAYWAFDRLIHYNVTMFGLETGLTALTMTALLLALSSASLPYRDIPAAPRKINLAVPALLAVAMTFSRLDTVFLALLAGAWILLRGTPIRVRLMSDIAIIVSAAFVSMAMRAGLPQYFAYTKTAIILAALGLVVQIPIFYFLGFYRASAHNTQYALRFTFASLLGSGVVSALMIGLMAGGALAGLPRSALPVYAGIVFAGAGIVRLATRNHTEQTAWTWRRLFGEGVIYYGILGGALAVYMLFNKIVFGAFTPVSGQVKHWWGSLQGTAYGNPITSLSGFLGLESAEGLNAWGPVVYLLHNMKDWLGIDLWLALGLMLAAAAGILAARPKRAKRAALSLGLPLLLAGSLVQMFYYKGQGYAGDKDWYWVSQMLMFTLLGALLFDLITRPIRQMRFPSPQTGREIRGEGIIWLLTSLIVLAYLVPFASGVARRMTWGAARADLPYMDVLPFLESNTEEGALIGMTGGGNVGYFIAGRVIVNMDGLINSYDYFLALRAGRADEYLASIGLDYIFSNPDILQSAPYNGQFDEWSEKAGEFGRKNLLRYRP